MKPPAVWLGFAPILLLWGVIAIPHTLRTPENSYSHDFVDHLQYTRFLHEHKRLPFPGEGGETQQPPLYYLIASQLAFHTPHHVLAVRFFSIFLGAITLFLLMVTLNTLGLKPLPGALALMFCLSTPAFVFLFTTYNNDALVIFLSVALWALFVRYVQSPSTAKAVALAMISLAGCFSKFSFGAVLISVGAAAAYLRWRGLLAPRPFHKFILLQCLVAPCILGWMYFRNLERTNTWLAINPLRVPWQSLPVPALQSILTPPGFTHWEWATPFADPFMPVGKKSSLTAYALVTSALGEYAFQRTKEAVVWFIVWTHIAWLAAALAQVRGSRWMSVMGLGLGIGWVFLGVHLLLVPYGSAMDFRHVAWMWLPLTVLRARSLEQADARAGAFGKWGYRSLLLLGIVAQWSLVAAG